MVLLDSIGNQCCTHTDLLLFKLLTTQRLKKGNKFVKRRQRQTETLTSSHVNLSCLRTKDVMLR